MKALKLVCIFVNCLLTMPLQAQQLKGIIVNEANQPLEAAYIYNLDSKSHAHSLENGVFVLEATQVGDSLRVGLLGYKNAMLVVTQANFQSKLMVVLNEKSFQLDELVITETLNPVSTISRLDINTNSVNSSQDILRKVPGLIIGQHAGGGKAEQIF